MAGQPEQWAFKVVETYAQDPRAFTQGLLHDGRTLILGTGQYGHSSIRRVDLASGATLARRNLDRHLFGEGVARHGEILYQLTWKRSEEHTSELQSRRNLVCRLLLEKKND